jgi:hypothetical protein
MLIEYILRIDTGTRTDLEADASVGFKNGVYRLTTGHSTGYCNCLDGSSFSDISQENMILKGGELSLVENVRIKIVSEDIIIHIVRNGIKLVGCKASMSVRIEESSEAYSGEKEIFKEMLVFECSQLDEVSFEITLVDAAFANVEQLTLKVPQGFGGGAQLETSFGGVCPLNLYKQDKRETEDKAISQGLRKREEVIHNPELEPNPWFDVSSLVLFNDKPSFVKNFAVTEVRYEGQNRPAELLVCPIADIPGSLKEKRIEICSGQGRGNSYVIKEVRDENISGSLRTVLILSRPVGKDEILAISKEDFAGLQRVPRARDIFTRFLGTSTLFNDSIFAYDKIKHSESSPGNFSVFKFCEPYNLYAVPKMNNIYAGFPEGGTGEIGVQIASDDGSFSDISIEAECMEETKDYTILRFPGSLNGKKTVSEIGRHQPRWSHAVADFEPFANGATNGNPKFELIKYAVAGDRIASDALGPQSVGYLNVISDPYNILSFRGVQASLYWRIDDLSSSSAFKIRPRFSFRAPREYILSVRALLIDDAGNAIDVKNYGINDDDRKWYRANVTISLTNREVTPFLDATVEEEDWNLLAELQDLLMFNLESKARAKYIYLQLFFAFSLDLYGNIPPGDLFFFSASPVEYEKEFDIDKMRIKGKASLSTPLGNISSTARDLCSNFGISTDKQSFNDVSLEILKLSRHYLYNSPFIPFKHGDNFQDKLAEICRAANFSMLSDGSKLYAKYFLSDAKKWVVGPASVIKGSFEVRNVNSVATEWDFSANTWSGQKTLFVNADLPDSFPDFEWSPKPSEPRFSAELIYRGYLDNDIQGFGANVQSDNVEKLLVGNMYLVKFVPAFVETEKICKLVSLRMHSSGEADALFVNEESRLSTSDLGLNTILGIIPVTQERGWRSIAYGSLDVDKDSARDLWRISKAAFEENKKRAKLDERYSKHQIAAFGNDSSWLKNFLSIAEYNSFAKTIVSFKVPIDCLPEGSLSSLLLKRATLAFGRFRNNPLDGWIVGYSLIPSEDAVRIEFINSEPVEEISWLDENKNSEIGLATEDNINVLVTEDH